MKSDYKWITYKFNCVPKHYWDDKKMQREYFDDVAKQLNIQNWTGIDFREFSHAVRLVQVQSRGFSEIWRPRTS